ncbi:MAG TPA: aminotransferase class III-fold pyridoxal phosphate-dependent enzyme, partial [Rhodocyclaceae bacterium]|nr:aminotransferase class III-fold pyridoxal phosphate-dependent enzyme [Rhodocyclaceae bacterium]
TCGYHGWQDWYIGATARHKGVPQAVRDLTRVFPYNDLDALARLLAEHPGQYAAVIMEPMNADEPRAGFLEGVRALAHEHGALFILDEIITGFRYHLGGAQSLFGVEPDLATFGKSMGNGFPISAVVGKARYMREMEEIFFSGTFGGEAVSLAAAIATIGKMRREPVLETLHERGARVIEHVGRALDAHGLSDCIRMKGRPSWSLMQFSDRPGASLWEIKSLYLQEMLAQGILTAGSHNMCYAHTDADLDRLFTAQERAFGSVARALAAGDIRDRLAGPAIQPIFRVR